ncbi:hypothetical protein [Burkholderia gladioli]|uniref:hypothetical protein n=1 Tax=Burkholderia gladioli TaxID=28095 RepID=UPI00163F2C9F|nr:hypothetical protein [Burkholderia gladioli]
MGIFEFDAEARREGMPGKDFIPKIWGIAKFSERGIMNLFDDFFEIRNINPVRHAASSSIPDSPRLLTCRKRPFSTRRIHSTAAFLIRFPSPRRRARRRGTPA